MENFSLTSEAFADGEFIPTQYTCEGDNFSPPLEVANVPEGAKSFALIVDDPDIPSEVKESMGIEVFDHWVAYNIPPSTNEIAAGEAVGVQGQNSSGEVGYTGPCPPAEYEPTEHRYVFSVYALDTTLDLSGSATKDELMNAIDGHVLASAELVGRYEKQEE